MLGFVVAAAITIGVLGVAGAPYSAYYWPPLLIGVAGLAISLGFTLIWRDLRGLPVLLAALIALSSVVLAAQHHFVVSVIVLAAFIGWILVWIPRSMRSRRIRIETEIARDPQTVFEFASDIRNWTHYLPGVTSAQKITDGPVRVGTRFDVTMRMGSVLFREVDKVVEYQAPSRFAWSSKAEASSAAENLTFARNGASTHVTHEVTSEETYSVALLGMALANPLLSWVGARDRRENLARLKRILESEHPL